ncbi:glycoside hydrolase family protein [Desertivirga xinjiangensis]|uniref:glycoside hydrolase family protein n=1 Tax=Desertivirga xinjiangensis TaxID=539206 RepID=UPI00210B1E23|nr:peptidoglycan-binding protein [Pedobacter xinjiangensis]
MEIREVSTTGIQFLIKEEGLVKRPYLDSVGIPTIGIGCTYYEDGRKVKMTDPAITTERAISLFKNMLRTYERAVYSVTRDDINHNQFDAMASLTYNIGVNGYKGSTVVKLVNQDPNDLRIKAAFEMWKNAGGKPILLGRRKREAALYFTPDAKPKIDNVEDIYKNQVKYVQAKLKIPVDGIFGPQTRAAVIASQKAYGLVPDGIVGPKTLQVLNKLSA